MRIVLATGNNNLNEYIETKLSGIEVVGITVEKNKIYADIKSSGADCIVITSDLLPPSNTAEDILKRIVKETDTKIVYFYGAIEPGKEHERAAFINFLISKGIYNYHYAEITPKDIENLIFQDRIIDDCKKDMLLNTPEIIYQDESKVDKPLQNTLFFKQKVVSIFGKGGKSSNGLNLGVCIAEQLPESNVLFLDLDIYRPSIQFYLNSDNFSSLSDFRDEIKNKTEYTSSDSSESIFKQLAFAPFKNVKNFHVIQGFVDDAYKFKLTDIVSSDDIVFIINSLKNYYDCIIIDTHGDLRDVVNQYIYKQSNIKLFFTEQSYNALEYIRRVQANLDLENDESVYYIFNHYYNSILDIDNIKSSLQNENILKIGYYNKLNESLINGKMLYFEDEAYRDEINAIASKIHKLDIRAQKKSFIPNLLSYIPKIKVGRK